MPDQHGGGGKPQPKEHVKKHLEKSHVKAEDVPDSVIKKLNEFTKAELDAMFDQVGLHGLDATLKSAYPESKQVIAAVH
jgi:hypothetical protein